ncbi:4-hydroxy-3-methylbut-2-enyl diphosphate reductase [Desulfobotulus sp. H1]|uniref:4-hydroxy-3-methylbut-2-enyl diphosphate reductase n=1 Tax=Desulfobotulus pelophilus TaxID=2823377 RepID=A0ABT3N6R2_9BACT|nr:4-hydroxy-3-methylbut-2-enyl diphosphate reductase [Desulfobotulus pelophilus]MCW7752851.1 4-hydroxy-3-methylbut-2-enyl diphosphate reductase [Desulfobotulus pelophilus]
MHIQIAKTAGFCMGVRRAVDMAIDAANKNEGPICTYGPLIHNPQVLDILKEKGIPTLSHIPEKGEGTVIIRAHGIPPATRQQLTEAGFHVMDATCPRVIRVQTIIRKHAESGHHVIIAGDEDHPEVVGLLGYGGDRGHVINTVQQLEALPIFEKAILVAQTTQNTMFYETIHQWALHNAPHYKMFNTICDSTEKRQTETMALAKGVDLVIVVGGKNSGNTQRLAEVATEAGATSLHIESARELDTSILTGKNSIGITAGASTPNWILRQVVSTLEKKSMENSRNRAHGWIKRIQLFLLSSNIYLAMGAAAVSYAASMLQGFPHEMRYSFIAAAYILSMQIFNNLTGIPSDRYNNPERASLYEKGRLFFFILASTAGLAGLYAAFQSGLLPFFLLFFMSLAGSLYNTPLLPPSLSPGGIRSLKDIPGSKTILIAIAWGVLCVILPSVGIRGVLDFASLGAFVFITILVFVRTAFFDILAIQGDRIVGKETLPILLGEQASHRLLTRMLTAIFVGIFLLTPTPLFPCNAFILALPPFVLIWMLRAEAKGRITADTRLAFHIESLLIFTGILAAIGLQLG